MRKIIIFDTTLRDGEQSPGATLSKQEKLEIAKQLEKLGVDYIEAGFPISSKDDFNAVKEIAENVNTGVCALARCKKEDIEAAWNAIKNTKKPRIHIFMSSSKIHLEHQFKISEEDALDIAVKGVKLAKKYCEDVEFSPMDATRTDKDFLFKMVEKCIEAGATTVNIPDTVGCSQPSEFGALIKEIAEKFGKQAKISVHCHNDLGLAVANSLEAVRNGAVQVECTINGLGERAGNAALEEVVMSLYSRKSYFNAETNINLNEIFKTSKMVSELTGISIQKNKAVVGENSFSHESGIHQHGLLANKKTYEFISPETIGRKTELVLGKHSGKHAVKKVLEEKGFSLNDEEVLKITEKIKELADQKKKVSDNDLKKMVEFFKKKEI